MASIAAAAASTQPVRASLLLSSSRATAGRRALAASRRISPSSSPSLRPSASSLSRPCGSDHAALFGHSWRFGSKGFGFALSLRCFSALSPELRSTLDKVVKSHKVVLFMKGTKDFPQCGFSNTVVQILQSLNVPFDTVNILENEMLRQGLKDYSNWPTFPQLYIDGEFFGGCDITVGGCLGLNILGDYYDPAWLQDFHPSVADRSIQEWTIAGIIRERPVFLMCVELEQDESYA